MDCLRTHKDSVHEGKKYWCDICEKTCFTKAKTEQMPDSSIDWETCHGALWSQKAQPTDLETLAT